MYEIMNDLGLTYDEQRAILEYKSSGSYTLNDDLRGGETLSAEAEMLKNNTNSALDKFPTYKGIVYRNIGFPTIKKFNAFVDEHTWKKTITYSAFISTSKSADGYVVDAPYTVHYEIESLNGRDVSGIGIVDEREVLFKTDTMFELSITQRTDKHIMLKMKEVMNNGNSQPYGTLEDRNERPTIGRDASEFEDSRELKEVHTGTDTIRGRSSVYDEIHNGTSDSDRRRIESGSEPKNVGGNTEIRNDSRREGLLSGLTDKCELIATKHTATGDDIWVVKLKCRISPEEYKDLNGKVKAVGGYYSIFAKAPDGELYRDSSSKLNLLKKKLRFSMISLAKLRLMIHRKRKVPKQHPIISLLILRQKVKKMLPKRKQKPKKR